MANNTNNTAAGGREKMNVYQKLIGARAEVLNKGMKKSGNNTFAKFTYFELDDIVPVVTPIFRDYGLVTVVNFGKNIDVDGVVDEYAEMKVINCDNPAEEIVFRSPVSYDGKGNNAIQNIGAAHTYMRRYLYLLACDLCECDEINANIGKDRAETKAAPAAAQRPKNNTIAEAKATQPAESDAPVTESDILKELCKKYAKANGLTSLKAAYAAVVKETGVETADKKFYIDYLANKFSEEK